jgi:hypothetical protein
MNSVCTGMMGLHAPSDHDETILGV